MAPNPALPPPGAKVVLLAEDDRDTLDLYVEFLSSNGFFLQTATNGLQALDMGVRLRPDVVVTDLTLPGLDGIELCRRLIENDRTRDIPIIAVTGHPVDEQDVQRECAGVVRVLQKPCLPETLAQEIELVLSHSRRRNRQLDMDASALERENEHRPDRHRSSGG